MSDIWRIAGGVILPNLGGFLNGHITRKHIDSWYKKLKFPFYRPPNWIFAPVWLSLYSGMGYASYLVWRDGGGFSGAAKAPLIVYGIQLTLNWAWTPIFFGQHNIKGGLFDITALTAAASVCGLMFYKVNKLAGLVFVPYITWLGFATLLNYDIYKLNLSSKKLTEQDKTR